MTPLRLRPALSSWVYSAFLDARPRGLSGSRPLCSAGSPRRGCSGAAPATLPRPSRGPSAAMPCSEDIAAVSPSKRARPSEAPQRLRFMRLSEHATAPTRGSALAAGFDLYSAYDYTIPPMEKALVKTDIQIALPSGCYGRVAPRSGLAAKHFIDVGVKKGDRIAQLICERIYYPEIEEVQGLEDTERGAGGFGSTGKN
ncbi:PREDICTED: deoxyuridine 5'-triphosphate nucleotidohydrolase, mitochondrial isoform X2 [Chinchilla lanigera]|uniref:deoxyuridine 5'-triphosphate nucleotidohydrolase, mitochondrial isoform X2 n=1 Tax=Chinchilla lanigera TaxID=34839 RepID=UPI000696CB30|nr:PREDICTED: deoxyuridine 5'-triphosphate nucleotidohydrolase, mitochondrial isoform X2 [Chinchilla lanigera]